MTAKFGTDLLKTQLKLMDSSLFQSFQALSPSTLNMEEAILFDSKELPTRSCGEFQDSIYCHGAVAA